MPRIHKMFLVLAVVFLLALTSTAGQAQVYFVNLSNKKVYVAKQTYQPYQSQSGGLMVTTDEGWHNEGWWSIAPGESLEMEAGRYYYLQSEDRSITWNNLEESYGLVKNDRFNVFQKKSNYKEEFQKLIKQGYREVKYQQFTGGTYQISGTAYRVNHRMFDFHFESRDFQTHQRWFEVPGKVIDFGVSSEDRWVRTLQWTKYPNRVSVMVSTEGEQVRPFGPREPGIYRGNVTVTYIERR